jgi:hypothetical protein
MQPGGYNLQDFPGGSKSVHYAGPLLIGTVTNAVRARSASERTRNNLQSGNLTTSSSPAHPRQTRQQRMQRDQRRMIGDAVDASGAEMALEGGDDFHGRAVIFA